MAKRNDFDTFLFAFIRGLRKNYIKSRCLKKYCAVTLSRSLEEKSFKNYMHVKLVANQSKFRSSLRSNLLSNLHLFQSL